MYVAKLNILYPQRPRNPLLEMVSVVVSGLLQACLLLTSGCCAAWMLVIMEGNDRRSQKKDDPGRIDKNEADQGEIINIHRVPVRTQNTASRGLVECAPCCCHAIVGLPHA